ncbi:MAG TPA: hypothetical protein PKK60_01860 [archaeon]|nr:hypothetical protein [archaeon]
MSLARLEAELIRVKSDLDKVKNVNTDFDKVLSEMKVLRERAIANPETKKMISNEMKNKEILELFSSIESDFESLRSKLAKQTIEKEELMDFVESIRLKKNFSFNDSVKAISFVDRALEEMECTHVSLRPEFIGTLDLTELSLKLKLTKESNGVIVEHERIEEVLTYLLAKRQLRNLVLDAGSAKINFKSSQDIVVEAENANIKELVKLKK